MTWRPLNTKLYVSISLNWLRSICYLPWIQEWNVGVHQILPSLSKSISESALLPHMPLGCIPRCPGLVSENGFALSCIIFHALAGWARLLIYRLWFLVSLCEKGHSYFTLSYNSNICVIFESSSVLCFTSLACIFFTFKLLCDFSLLLFSKS